MKAVPLQSVLHQSRLQMAELHFPTYGKYYLNGIHSSLEGNQGGQSEMWQGRVQG